MFLFKGGRFSFNGASFMVPDEFYVDLSEDECSYEDAMAVISPDKKIKFLVCFDDENCDPVEELKALVRPGTGYEAHSPISPVEVNGLSGRSLLYGNRKTQTYHAIFPLKEGGHMEFIADSDCSEVSKVVESDHFKAMLAGIRLED